MSEIDDEQRSMLIAAIVNNSAGLIREQFFQKSQVWHEMERF